MIFLIDHNLGGHAEILLGRSPSLPVSVLGSVTLKYGQNKGDEV
jgi:hypothetical protein